MERSTLVWLQEVRRRAVLLKLLQDTSIPFMLPFVSVWLSLQQLLYSKIIELRHHVFVPLPP